MNSMICLNDVNGKCKMPQLVNGDAAKHIQMDNSITQQKMQVSVWKGD